MELLFETLKYILPAALVLLAVWLINKQNEKQLKVQQAAIIRAEVVKQQLPVKLNALERAILYLDRIKPEHLLLRVPVGAMSVSEAHQELVSNVRSEYEHNMVQQLYISPEAWQMLLGARDEVLTLLNTIRMEMQEEDTGINYAKMVLERAAQLPPPSIQNAMIAINREASSILQM
jgi:hypothetical protein